MNRFVWNLRYPDATSFPGMILWAGEHDRAARLTGQVPGPADGGRQDADADVRGEEGPAARDHAGGIRQAVSLSLQVRDKLSRDERRVIRIREVRKQLEEYAKRDDKRVADAAKALIKKLTAVEEELYQTKNRASQDPLNYPIKLNNKLAHVLGVVPSSDNQPTQQSYMVYEDLATQVNAQLKALTGLLTSDLAGFNRLVHDANLPAVQVK